MKYKILVWMIAAVCLSMFCTSKGFAGTGYGPGYTADGELLPPSSGGIDSGIGDLGTPGVWVGDSFLWMDTEDSIVKPEHQYTYDQMVSDIRLLQERYGSRLQTRVLGASLDGRDIYEIIIGNPQSGKHILIQAGIHGREYMTPLLVMKQIEYALAYYSRGSYDGKPLSELFTQAAIHFVPMTNPDGTSISQSGAGAIRSEELRQGLRSCYEQDLAEGRTSVSFEDYLVRWKANARGVDLNRNFDSSWEQIKDGAQHLSYAGYKGPAPLSEPESQILADLGNSYTWSYVISYHSMGQVIYWNGAQNQRVEESSRLAQEAAKATGYQVISEGGKGGFKDWMQSKPDPAAGITIEVGYGSTPLPEEQFDTVWEQNKSIWVRAVKYALDSGL